MSFVSTFRSRLTTLSDTRKQHRESGNSLIIVIMLAPIIFGAFGASVDLAVGTYTNSTLQSALDTATQTTLAQARNPGNNNTAVTPYLSQDEARTLVYRAYDANRTGANNYNENPTIICQRSANAGTLRAGATGCAWTEKSFSFSISANTLSLDVRVYEESAPLFLQMAGIDVIQYTIDSNARTTFTAG